MTTLNDHFDIALRKLLADEIEERANNLAAGNATDFAHYRYEAGFIAALHYVGGLCDDVQKSLQQR